MASRSKVTDVVLDVFGEMKYGLPWYVRLTGGWANWNRIVRITVMLRQMFCRPVAVKHWVQYMQAWMREWRDNNYRAEWLEGWDCNHPYKPVMDFVFYAWEKAMYGHGKRFRIFLPVVSNTFDAPCAGCGRCCRVPKGEGGYMSVQVFSWEVFRLLHPDVAKAHPTRPGEYKFKFVSDGKGGLQCPMLSHDGRCTAYGYRPSACVAFNCADGMSDYSEGMFSAGTFLRNVPEAKDRLVQLGFKQIDRHNIEKGLQARWQNSTPHSGSTTVAPCEASDPSHPKNVLSMS